MPKLTLVMSCCFSIVFSSYSSFWLSKRFCFSASFSSTTDKANCSSLIVAIAKSADAFFGAIALIKKKIYYTCLFVYEKLFMYKNAFGFYFSNIYYLYIFAYFSIAITHIAKNLAAVDLAPIFSSSNSEFLINKSTCLRTSSDMLSLLKSLNYNNDKFNGQ